MPHDDEWLERIRSDPENTDTVQVYADLLAERGDPRGRYLQLKIAMVEAQEELLPLEPQLDGEWLETVASAVGEPPWRLPGQAMPRLIELQQSTTYAGLLEGVPTSEMNERIVSDWVQRATRHSQHAAWLIAPVETPIELGRRYPFGQPARLPDVVSIGRFIAHLGDDDRELYVVWFQGEFGPPDAPTRAALRAIDWERYARVVAPP